MIKKLITENSIGWNLIQFNCDLWSKSQQLLPQGTLYCNVDITALKNPNNQTFVQMDWLD